jgi:hypothetical protein
MQDEMDETTYAVPTGSTDPHMLWKMLGALAAGATLGVLIGLPCGQEGNLAGSLRTVAQALIALAAPISLAFGLPKGPSLREETQNGYKIA